LVGLGTTTLMFLSPIFYPLSAIPEDYQILIKLNPLTFVLEASKSVIFFGQVPAWEGMLMYLLLSLLIARLGLLWFQKIRKGFADVL